MSHHDPWEQYATPASTSTATADPWSQYEAPASGAPVSAETQAILDRQRANYPSAQELKNKPKPSLTDTAVRNFVQGVGIDPDHPITGTLRGLANTVKSVSHIMSPFASPMTPQEIQAGPTSLASAGTAAQDTAAGLMYYPSELVQGINDNDTERIVRGLSGMTGMAVGTAAGVKGAKYGAELAEARRAIKLGGVGERSVSAISNMIQSGMSKNPGYVIDPKTGARRIATVNDYAAQTIPIWRQSAAELGKTAEQFPGKIGLPTDANRAAVRQGTQHAIDIADHAVDITNRPFEEVLKDYGNLSIEPTGELRYAPSGPLSNTVPAVNVKASILSDLEAAATAHSNNPPLQAAIRDLMSRVEKAKTFNDLQSLKVLANKNTEGLFSKSLGQQINATADSAYSWRVLSDTIRANMYPELSRVSGVNLADAGRLEGIVMDARDGLRQHVQQNVTNPHNARMQQTYWEHVADGSLYRRQLIRRALDLDPTPAGQFNTRFMRGVGGSFPAMPSSVPVTPRGTYNFAPETIAGTSQDLIPHVAPTSGVEPVPGQMNIFAPPPGNSTDIGQSIFGVQQRANREARMAPPPTLSGTQGELLPSGGPGMLAAPSTPITGNPITDYMIQQRQAQAWRAGQPVKAPGEQLSLMRGMTPEAAPESVMGVKQTPIRFNPMKRETYTMKDLREMIDEMNGFIQKYPNHPQVSELREDIRQVAHELYRRVEAHKVPSSKKNKPGPPDVEF